MPRGVRKAKEGVTKSALTGEEVSSPSELAEVKLAKSKEEKLAEAAENAARPDKPEVADKKPKVEPGNLKPWEAEFFEYMEPNQKTAPALWIGEEKKVVGAEIEVWDTFYVLSQYAANPYRKTILRERVPVPKPEKKGA